MKYITQLLRILIGALFIFSGAVKAIDPLGTAYKMEEYFEVLNWHIFNSYALPFSVIMIVVELILGITLWVGWKPKLTAWLLFLMTLFFTFLTGYTYLSGYDFKVWYNPSTWVFVDANMKVTDCGCFGDFMKLKPSTTFYKDIVFDVLILIMMFGIKHIKPLFKNATNNKVVFASTAITILFCFSNYVWGLPIVDFRPYKIGNNLRDQRQVIKPEIRNIIFTYKNLKTGEKKDFTMDEINNVPDGWDFDERKDVVLDPGIPAPISNLVISGEDGSDITDSILNYKDYQLVVVAYRLAETDADAFEKKLNPLAAACDKAGIKFYCLAGGDIDVDEFRHAHQTAYPFYVCDQIPLKTMIRSNPGLILIKDGVVIDMWHHMHFPDFEKLNEKYFLKK